ncbi:hypothetical protein ACIP4Y_25100 [Streptomyces sp. NPDC088810]|uniref:hypothetical protein n=1 Tax=unclassified Streptomyces TaxID=2593676 RepID=UPI003815819F
MAIFSSLMPAKRDHGKDTSRHDSSGHGHRHGHGDHNTGHGNRHDHGNRHSHDKY